MKGNLLVCANHHPYKSTGHVTLDQYLSLVAYFIHARRLNGWDDSIFICFPMQESPDHESIDGFEEHAQMYTVIASPFLRH